MFEFFIEPLSYPFMQNALFAGAAVAIVCAVLSCYMVLKGWALMGDAVSHAVLPGVILAYVLALPLSVGAFISGLGCALLTGYVKDNSRIKEDTVMGIVFSALFALGIVLFAKIETEHHLTHILFGNMLGVARGDMWQIIITSAIVTLILTVKYKDFMLYCFDKSHAKVAGLNVKLLHYGLLTLMALAIVASIQIVGVIMVVAMLIGPGIIALMLTKQFGWMMVVACLVSLFSTFAGVVISYHIDGATSSCIILVQSAIFIAVLALTKWKGRVVNRQLSHS
ncbi:metal ABC transporter permease [Vibrio sp. LaRot3]|uniref:metal ABC transporter permease n=1 Tax=Vibrio sp. LaRot3 TaxID=2998829 RepID=UPI0022CDEBB2|nr:metal ABC transporter permease [Vibrio sp. LaRot3]MDA0149163.1 metal ABC transporter permease [Vibrio sp. LaRot3]